jgi:hypothetical protein
MTSAARRRSPVIAIAAPHLVTSPGSSRVVGALGSLTTSVRAAELHASSGSERALDRNVRSLARGHRRAASALAARR